MIDTLIVHTRHRICDSWTAFPSLRRSAVELTVQARVASESHVRLEPLSRGEAHANTALNGAEAEYARVTTIP